MGHCIAGGDCYCDICNKLIANHKNKIDCKLQKKLDDQELLTRDQADYLKEMREKKYKKEVNKYVKVGCYCSDGWVFNLLMIDIEKKEVLILCARCFDIKFKHKMPSEKNAKK